MTSIENQKFQYFKNTMKVMNAFNTKKKKDAFLLALSSEDNGVKNLCLVFFVVAIIFVFLDLVNFRQNLLSSIFQWNALDNVSVKYVLFE